MAKDRRSRDQKRKAKLAKRKQKSGQSAPLAYMGGKYQTEKLTPVWMQTEIGIYESFVVTERRLTDPTVTAAVEKLIIQLRKGTLPPLCDDDNIQYEVGNEKDFVIEFIRRRWSVHFENSWQPPRDKLIGVLRSILGSIEKVQSPGQRSQSYLRHIGGFLTEQLGVSVQRVTEEMELLFEPEEDELILLGRKWINDENQEARAEFHELASELISDGEAEEVIDACSQLISEESIPLSPTTAELYELSIQARQTLVLRLG